jgi:hypothetical protein
VRLGQKNISIKYQEGYQEAKVYADLKSGEKVGKMFTQKMYSPTNCMIMSKHFLHFLADNLLR